MINRQTIAFGGGLVNVVLGMVSPRVGGEWHVHLSGTWVGNIAVKSYLPSSQGPSLGIADRQYIAYRVGKTAVVTDSAITTISTNGTYDIPCHAGEMVVLEMIVFTSGVLSVDAVPSPSA